MIHRKTRGLAIIDDDLARLDAQIESLKHRAAALKKARGRAVRLAAAVENLY